LRQRPAVSGSGLRQRSAAAVSGPRSGWLGSAPPQAEQHRKRDECAEARARSAAGAAAAGTGAVPASIDAPPSVPLTPPSRSPPALLA
jgi:hypothetical protein